MRGLPSRTAETSWRSWRIVESSTPKVPSGCRITSFSDQAESKTNAPSGVGRTATRGVLRTAFRATLVGFERTSREMGVASGM